MRGIELVRWRVGQGQVDAFLLARSDQADPAGLRMADVVVHPGQRSRRAAAELARDTLRRLTGCSVVIVDGPACLLMVRGARPVCVAGEAAAIAGLAYVLLALSRANRAASSSALGSPPSV
jgi:hypothetical protein